MLDDLQTGLNWAKLLRALLIRLATSADEPDSRRSPHHQYPCHIRSALAFNLSELVLRILIFSSTIFAVSLI